MNVYDFDQTIFYPDSSYCFVMYCLRHFPRAVLSTLPETIFMGILVMLKKADTKDLKEKVFSFLPRLESVDDVVEAFWRENEDRIQSWYLAQRRDDDLIISASPEFLLRPMADKLGFRLIATPMDPNTGRILGLNCHDEEKVRRFRKEYPGESIEEFYSDSLSDSPMAAIAKKAVLVKKGTLSPWPI